MKKYVIGIDLGGTKISTAIANLDGKVQSLFTMPTEANLGEAKVLENIITSIEKVIIEEKTTLDEVLCIGIGSPGVLDLDEGEIITSPNLPFANFKIISELKKIFDVDFYLDNDANVATIGEYLLGAGKDKKNIIYVTVSTGVGGGAIVNGDLYHGNTSNALEIGHMTVDINGPICGCGNYGCLEALSSGTAIAKAANTAIASKAETSLRQYDKVTSYEVFVEAKNGDVIANEIIDNALNYLGVGIANVITMFDPEMIIIGGGVSNAGEIIFEKVRNIVRRRNFKIMSDNCEIVKATLGIDAGVLGAISLALLNGKKNL
ncbi:ROK family protein [uncultured Clostridium sp.]|jgi:glucokinase|uniref:ROK family protein n=1 Tax=uncultured Clostridium sp. TaxID=59620 RepID=UPI0026136A8D|nr:ROK family protein [uncultured Clostridium sp.]